MIPNEKQRAAGMVRDSAEAPEPFKLRPVMYEVASRLAKSLREQIETDLGRFNMMRRVDFEPREMPKYEPKHHTGEFVAKRMATMVKIDKDLNDAITYYIEYEHRLDIPPDEPEPTHAELENDPRTMNQAIVVRNCVARAFALWNELVEAQAEDRRAVFRMRQELAKRRRTHKILKTPIMKSYHRKGANAIIHDYGEIGRLLIDQLTKAS